jgi:hypothetical protein
MSNRIDSAGSAVDQAAGDTRLAKQLHSAVDGVTFADRTEIQHDPFALKSNGPGSGIEVYEVNPGSGASGLKFQRVRDPAFPGHESPATDEWRDGDVKSSPGLFAQVPGKTQQRENFRGDLHRFARRSSIYLRDFTIGPEETQSRFNAVDLVERLLTRGAERYVIASVQDNLEPARHRVPGEHDRSRCWHCTPRTTLPDQESGSDP